MTPKPAAATAQRGALRRRLLTVAAVVLGLALVWTLALGWALPRLAQPRLEAAASAALGAPLRLGRIEIAPWSWQVRVFDLQLGPPESPWLGITEVHADLSSESVWRLAPVLSSLRLHEPRVALERLEAGRFNITPMLEALARRPPAPADAKPARFSLNNIRVQDGDLRFADRVAGAEHRVEALQLGVPFVSNLPADVTVDVEPLLEARINGSPLLLRGRTQPFSDGLHSKIDIDWKGLDLAAWFEALAPLLPQPLPLAVDGGRLDLALQIDFAQRGAPEGPLLLVLGGASVSELNVKLPAQQATLALQRLDVGGLALRPLERSVAIDSLKLQAPRVDLDLARLLAPAVGAAASPTPTAAAGSAAASAPTAEPSAPSGAWQWRVAQTELDDGGVLLRAPGWPDGQALAPITLRLGGLDARADAAPATLALSLADARGAALRVDGQLQVAARTVALQAELSGLQPAAWLAPWAERLPVRLLDGTLAAQARAELGGDGWRVADGALQLAGWRLQPVAADTSLVASKGGAAAPDRLALAKLDLAGLQLVSRPGAALEAEIATLRLEGLDLKALRDARGGLAWQGAPRASTDDVAPAASAPAPRWRVGELRCSGCALAFTDRSVTPPLEVGLVRSELLLRRVSDDLAKPVGFEFATQVQGGGRVRASGSAQPRPLALRSRVDIDALDLRALQPYLEPHANITLGSAKASVAGELQVDGDARQPVAALRWRGRLGLGELRALDAQNQAEFVRFKNLQLDAAELGWRPGGFEADLGTVTLEDFYGRVIVNADGRINLQDVAKRAGDAAPRSLTTPSEAPSATPSEKPPAADVAPVAPAASAPAAAAPAAPLPLRWRAIRLAGGTVDFTDNFIRPNYSAKLSDVAGEISALAWNDPQPATVKIAGKVDGSAPLEIGGTLHPLGARLATDITASARGIDVTRLSAYSGRYAGYGIEKGTLSVTVRYQIENGKLEASNKLYLDQLTFGDKVESPDALKLPVLLAVSLLKDRHGVIDIDLPISGSLDDPQFSVGGIIVRVIVNLITKAITAPFTLLASAFGGAGGQELGFVEFAPGSADLDDASRQRLDTLAKALVERPGLKLEATGHADAAVDETVLRDQHLDRLMRVAKAKASGELAESVKIEPAERARWLDAAYKATDLKNKPRNLIGLAKSLPPAEMEALLRDSAPVGEAPLRELADRRGDRVKAYLTAKVEPERVLLTASRLDGAGIEGPGQRTRVAFALK